MISRSLGVKLIVVCGLAFLMTIPAFFVEGLVNERSQRAADVISEISRRVGGPQTFLGPTLAIPFTQPPASPADAPKHSVYIVFPVQASAVLKTETEERRRSLFRVPVYQADLTFDGTFDLAHAPDATPQGAQLDWKDAEMILGVSDPRGALADATLTTSGKSLVLVPAQSIENLSLEGDENQRTNLHLLGAKLGGAVPTNVPLHVTSKLRFAGTEHLSILPYGKTTQVNAEGDWRNPGFDGGILPVSRSVSSHGFTAKWSVPFVARGVRAEGRAGSITGVSSTGLGMSFVELADPYQSVSRSLKYALVFLGLVFLSYFVFEVTAGKRIHPAQYILVGIAQLIFYLLLLSLSERIGFDLAFLLAACATVLLLPAMPTGYFRVAYKVCV